jgi:hypothetical protein
MRTASRRRRWHRITPRARRSVHWPAPVAAFSSRCRCSPQASPWRPLGCCRAPCASSARTRARRRLLHARVHRGRSGAVARLQVAYLSRDVCAPFGGSRPLCGIVGIGAFPRFALSGASVGVEAPLTFTAQRGAFALWSLPLRPSLVPCILLTPAIPELVHLVEGLGNWLAAMPTPVAIANTR